jgi:ligand-binding sensor domain-containing protein
MIKSALSLALTLSLYAVQTNQFAQHVTSENGLSHNQVNVLSVKPDQKLWLGGKRGISIFNGLSWQQIKLPENLGSHYITQNSIAHFKGATLIGTENGIAIYRRGNWQSLHQIKKQNLERITKIMSTDKAVWLWFGSNIAVSEDLVDWKLYSLTGLISDLFTLNNHAYLIQNNNIQQLQIDGTISPQFALDQALTFVTQETNTHVFAVAENRKIVRVDIEQKSQLPLAIVQADITALAYDSLLNRLWIGTSAGLYYLENQSLQKYQHAEMNSRYITALVVSTQKLGFQANSILWVGSYNGLYQVIQPATRILKFPATISSISENRTEFLVGSDDGMFRVGKTQFQLAPFLPNLFNSKRIEAQHRTDDKHLVATVDELFVLQNELVTYRTKTVNNVALTRIFKFIQTPVGVLILSKNGHVFAYQNNTLSLMYQSENQAELIDAALDSKAHQVWLLTEKSLESLDLSTKQITHNLKSHMPAQPTALAVDESGLIFGTENNLIQIRNDSVQAKPILASTAIEGIYQQSADVLFVRSDRKIYGLKRNLAINSYLPFYIANAEDGVNALRSPRFFYG